MTDFLQISQQAARAGGAILMEYRGRVHPRQKGPNDFVTEADFASQDRIRQVLREAFPDHGFLGEECSGTDPSAGLPPRLRDQEYCWVVDPLDGTMNYVHDLPNYSVSVALCHRGDVIAGAVFDPLLDECFSAQSGGGAHRNGQPIETSDCRPIEEALIAVSLASELPRQSPEVLRLVEVMHRCLAIRRMGSAALNLCYVASGRLDGYWATSVQPWDVAAGQLIVQEAGGTVTGLDGSAFDLDRPQFVAAATVDLQHSLRGVLEQAVSDRRA
jgi:myo-inositol-1(or 4)-monophosphatase